MALPRPKAASISNGVGVWVGTKARLRVWMMEVVDPLISQSPHCALCATIATKPQTTKTKSIAACADKSVRERCNGVSIPKSLDRPTRWTPELSYWCCSSVRAVFSCQLYHRCSFVQVRSSATDFGRKENPFRNASTTIHFT